MHDHISAVVWVLAGGLGAVLLRELLCWYWKVNEVVGLLKTMVVRLEALEGRRPGPAPAAPVAAPAGGEIPPFPAKPVNGGGLRSALSGRMG
jgi:hypothetical protein